MLKALLKKQISETLAFFLRGKDGKRRSQGALIGLALLTVYGLGAVGAMFWLMSSTLCAPFISAGQGWIYFAFMGTVATAFGIVGGIFTAKTRLYEAKDNELLLSMPIPTWAILFVRMIGLYLFTLLFEALVFVPAAVNYFLVVGFDFWAAIGCLLVQLVMPLLALAICCLLGFVLAWLTAKLPWKNLLTIVGFAVFMVVYFLLYSKVNEYLGYVIANGEAVGAIMKTVLYPFSQMGYAAEGKMLSLFLFLLIFGGMFAIVYAVISMTYLRIATMKHGERRTKYKEKKQRIFSPQTALFKRELLHFIKSPVYMLNSSMGTLFALIMCVMIPIKGDLFGITSEAITSAETAGNIASLVAVIICFTVSSNTMAACSVSLEGERITLVQALPVRAWEVLKAKLYLHVAMTAVPAMICALAMGLVVRLTWIYILLAELTAIVCTALFAAMDLAINLKLPNLRWTNEAAAVKQGMSTLAALFGGWGAALLPLGGYFLFGKYLPMWSYILLWLAIFAVGATLILIWLKKRGAKIFASL